MSFHETEKQKITENVSYATEISLLGRNIAKFFHINHMILYRFYLPISSIMHSSTIRVLQSRKDSIYYSG